jgi:hypothetical protein
MVQDHGHGGEIWGLVQAFVAPFRPAFRLMGSIVFSAFPERFISYGHLPGCIAGRWGWQSDSRWKSYGGCMVQGTTVSERRALNDFR